MADNGYNYDVLVIGSGPGGYVAAIRAAQLGLRAAVVEKGGIGGVCLNIGCIPTKAIIHQAEIYRNRSGLAAMGVGIDDSGFRYENVFNTSRRAAETLSKGVSYLLKKNGVEVIAGAARVVSGHDVLIKGNFGSREEEGERSVSAGAIIAATGSRPRVVPGLEFDGGRVLSSDDALMLRELPRRALIVGSGSVGMEFAHIFNAFGVEVHIVEMAERLLPLADGEIAAVLARSFLKRGIKVYTSSKVSSHMVINGNNGHNPVGATAPGRPCLPETNGGPIEAVIEGADGGQTTVSVDKIFVMAGRAPNTGGIGLEDAGISLADGGFVEVGDYYQTSVPSIYAIGDIVASSPMLAHVASAAGEIAAEHIAGRKPRAARVDPVSIPGAVYCEPQAASFGLTEEQALARGVQYGKASFPFRACGKAVTSGAPDGMVKIMVDSSTRKIIGAHIAGAGASELIHELLLARNAGIGPADIATMVHAHPTLSETIMESARALDGWAIHV